MKNFTYLKCAFANIYDVYFWAGELRKQKVIKVRVQTLNFHSPSWYVFNTLFLTYFDNFQKETDCAFANIYDVYVYFYWLLALLMETFSPSQWKWLSLKFFVCII